MGKDDKKSIDKNEASTEEENDKDYTEHVANEESVKISNLKVVQDNVSGNKHDAFSEDQNNNRDDETTVLDVVKEAENRVTENSLKEESDLNNENMNKNMKIDHEEEEWVSPNDESNSDSSLVKDDLSFEQSEISDNVDLSHNTDNGFDEKTEPSQNVQITQKEIIDNAELSENKNIPTENSNSNGIPNVDVNDNVNLPLSAINHPPNPSNDNMNSQGFEENEITAETEENIDDQVKKEVHKLTENKEKSASDEGK